MTTEYDFHSSASVRNLSTCALKDSVPVYECRRRNTSEVGRNAGNELRIVLVMRSRIDYSTWRSPTVIASRHQNVVITGVLHTVIVHSDRLNLPTFYCSGEGLRNAELSVENHVGICTATSALSASLVYNPAAFIGIHLLLLWFQGCTMLSSVVWRRYLSTPRPFCTDWPLWFIHLFHGIPRVPCHGGAFSPVRGFHLILLLLVPLLLLLPLPQLQLLLLLLLQLLLLSLLHSLRGLLFEIAVHFYSNVDNKSSFHFDENLTVFCCRI